MESDKIAQELVTILLGLKSTGKVTRYESFLQAIKTAWKSDKIKITKQRLNEIQAGIQFHIQILMREDQPRNKDEILHALDEASRKILLQAMKDRDENKKQQQASNALASARHNQMVDLVTKLDLRQGSGTNDVVAYIKAQLQFRRQSDRFDDIVEAHQTTFRWIFEDNPTSNTSCPDFHTWLRNGQGIYWVSGKAGSGKSTLMKYLSQEPALQTALDLWADGTPLLIVSFYFWNAGSDMQKSQEGLFQTICFQILDQDPSFGEVLFPEQFLPGASWQEFPTFHELRRAFSRFRQSLDGKTKVVMLIDGLDEFDEISLTMTELAELFITATKSTHIKAVLSSRPLTPFEFAFKHQPKLRLHELTREDIATYVNDELSAHSRFSDLNVDDAKGVERLSQDIVRAAAGVFLWVRLVVRSLLEGIQNYDRAPDLQRRLQALPQDLEALFSHMLHNVPAEYKLESSRIFQLVTSHYSAPDERVPLSALTLGLAEEHCAQAPGLTISELPEAARHYIEEQVAGRLRSRCAGLLEIQLRDDRYPQSANVEDYYPPVPCVEYLHKSVADFLGRGDIRADILQYTRGTDFNAEISLLQAAVQRVRGSKSDLVKGDHLWSSLKRAMIYARGAENSTKSGSTQLLDELDTCMTEHFRSIVPPEIPDELKSDNGCQMTSWYDCIAFHIVRQFESPDQGTFMSFVIEEGLALYVQTKLTQIGRQGIRKRGRPLLHYACDVGTARYHSDQMARVKIVQCLLKYGADTMERWGEANKTAWERALVIRTKDPIAWVNIIRLFVDYGADMNMRISDPVLDLEEMDDRSIEWSTLSYVKRRMEISTKDPSDPDWYEWGFHLDYQDGVPLPAHVVMEAKAAFEDLIRDMIARGAKDGYREIPNDASPDEANDRQQDMSDTRALPKIQRPRSTRNPLKRLLQRLKS